MVQEESLPDCLVSSVKFRVTLVIIDRQLLIHQSVCLFVYSTIYLECFSIQNKF